MSLQPFVDAGLSGLELKVLFQDVLGKPVESDIDEEESAILWVAVLLKRVKPPLSDLQQMTILRAMFRKHVKLVVPPPDRNHPLDCPEDVMLGFIDGKYAIWDDSIGFIDLSTGDYVNETPMVPLMIVCYDLSEFVRRQTAGGTNASTTTDS